MRAFDHFGSFGVPFGPIWVPLGGLLPPKITKLGTDNSVYTPIEPISPYWGGTKAHQKVPKVAQDVPKDLMFDHVCSFGEPF